MVTIDTITADLQAVEGETIELNCNASGNPSPLVVWYRYKKDGQKEESKWTLIYDGR